MKAFTVKQSEVGQFFATRFDGCERTSSNPVDSLAVEMKRAALARGAGVFKMISMNSDRYAVAGIESLFEALNQEPVQHFLAKG